MWPLFLSLYLALSRMAPRKALRRRPAFRRPLLEGLEERTVPSVFTVTNTGDNCGVNPAPFAGTGTLRQAIIDANATNTGTAGSPDLIEFAIPASDPGHLYYTNLTAQATATTAATDDSTVAGIDPAWPHSWWSIQPVSALPAITDPVIIDGYSQPGARPNALAAGDNAVLRIELNGSAFAGAELGASLGLGAGLNINLNTTVQGLVINRFVNGLLLGWGIGSIPTQYDTIQGNFIGTDVSGAVDEGNLLHGINVGSQNNTIGGTAASARNVISGNGYNGVYIISASNNSVLGNLIGTNAAGTAALANGSAGVGVNTPGGGAGVAVATTAYGVASGNTIGGTSTAAGNVISGNAGWGLFIDGPDNLVQGNLIGTDVSGMNPLGNGGPGVELSGPSVNTIGGSTIGGSTIGAGNLISANYGDQVQLDTSSNTVQGNSIGTNLSGTAGLGSAGALGIVVYGSNNLVGGTTAGAGNTIAFNTHSGVDVYSGTGNSILGNSIHDNGGLGIDLASGTNNNQAAPVLTSAFSGPGVTTVTGTITSTSSATARVEFFANTAGDPEGRTLLGSCSVPTDAAGHGNFTAVLSAALPTGQSVVTATVTDPGGDTSEFSAGVTATPLPSSLSGVVWEDFNDDGQVDFGENGIDGVTITLTGTDFLGNAVNVPQTTSGGGAYSFLNLLPGSYYLTETPPAGYVQGIDSVGTAGGSVSATDQFSVSLSAGVDGMNYNFGEQPPAGSGVKHGQTAGIGFWNNKNGQALIKALNGGTGTQLADWLAATLPNTFGKNAGANNLLNYQNTGQVATNAQVAALFQQDFVMKGVKLDAQLLATALSVYATNATLDPTKVAATYGFTVSGDGAGVATANVGSNGDAFGVANNSTLTLMDLLLAADAQAVSGVLYNGNAAKRNEANNVFSAVNQAGGL